MQLSRGLKFLQQTREEFVISFPNILFQFLNSIASYGIAIIVARISISSAAAYSLINTFVMVMTIFSYGILTSVGIFLSHNRGGNQHATTQKIFSSNFYLVLLLSLFMMLIYSFYPDCLQALSQSQSVVSIIDHYFAIFIWSIFPNYLGIYLLQVLLSAQKTQWSLYTNILRFVLLFFFVFVLVNGCLGFKPLGMNGAGLAYVLVSWLMLPLLIYYASISKMPISFKDIFKHFDKAIFMQSIRIGLPIAFTLMIELVLHAINSIFAGKLGVTQQAAYLVFVQSIVAIVLIPFAVSQCVAVRVSYFCGGANFKQIKLSITANLFIALAIVGLLCGLFLYYEIGLFTLFFPNYANLSILVKQELHLMMIIAVLLLMIETIRLIAVSTLRGLQDVGYSLIVNIISFLCLGVYTSYYLTFQLHQGVCGLAYGELIAVASSAFLLIFRLFHQLKQHNLINLNWELQDGHA